jgi:membrane-associated phospholipid phosphatase
MAEPSPDRAIPGPTLLAVGTLFLLGFLFLILAAAQQRLDWMDQGARAFVHQRQGPRLEVLMEVASAAGGQPGQLAVVLMGSLILWRRRPWWALILPVAMAGAGVVQFTAKWAIGRARPNLHPWGFPSAHVLSLVVLTGLLVYLVGRAPRGRRWQPLAAGVAGGAVVVVGYSRMYLDAHWLSDVLGGVMAGLAYVLIVIWLVEAAPRLARVWGPAPQPGAAESLPVPGLVAPVAEPLIVPAATAVAAPATLATP